MGSDLTAKRGLPPGKAIRSDFGLIAWLGFCFLVAGLGGAVTSTTVGGWYLDLNKPSWNPPSWLFGPVWTALYTMMAVAAWLVWRRDPTARRTEALRAFGAQLGLNLLWSCLFFGFRNPGLALIEIVLLWSSIALTIKRFHPVCRTAAWLMSPYLAWTTFAAALNLAIWTLNR